MLAYTKGITKKEFVAELLKHQIADNFISGEYDNGFGKGCAVGCSLMSVAKLKKINISMSDHAQYPKHLGIPEWLARLEDTLFENLSKERQKVWPVEFGKAINMGADLEKVKLPFILFLLRQNIKIQIFNLKDNKDNKNNKELTKIIRRVISINKQMIVAQNRQDKNLIAAAESAARLAAESAAWSAESAAWSAAWLAESAAWSAQSVAWLAQSVAQSVAQSAQSAAWSVAQSAAWSAAWLAAESAAWSAAWLAAYEFYGNKLLKLLRACK